ncbi:carbohydrate ABC transporter permease [Exiguobacterium acetylicum]|uniref:carbohydrate ABC transporter permease n=1 Tax=Exiguobacterium TaxID=33986 RepID=UPI000ED8E370|nr:MULTISPECIES: carbohydrate ABC transporter permease [Exiguobacterium]MDQ6466837.1 carbohydrate ABC transporter permease [Exiguobacterium acetylicum]HAB32700.1 carbohydrate ABC transporter permease [Exiguobacterium sp.]
MRHKKTTTILLLTVASLLSIIFLLPLVWMILTSFKTLSDSLESASLLPKSWTLENYRLILNASSESPLIRWLLNTTIVTVLGTLLVLFVDVLAAYALARLQIPGRKIILAIVVIALTIPGIVTLFPAFYLFRQAELLDSYVPLIVPYAAGTLGVFLIYNFLRTFPKDLEEAAYLDGANQWQVLTKVILPTLRPIITTLGIVTFLAIYNDFLWPSLVTNEAEMKTMTLGIATLVQGSNFVNPAAMMASTVIATLPALLLFIWANRFFVKGITHSGLK